MTRLLAAILNPDIKGAYILAFTSVFTALQQFCNTYIFEDWQYSLYLLVLILVDTALGLTYAARERTLSSYGFGMIVRKLLSYFALLIMAHILVHYKIDGAEVTLFAWVDDLVFASLLVKEAISILENIGRLNSKWLPGGLLRRLRDLQKTKGL